MEIAAAERHLKRADPVMLRLIGRFGPCEIEKECRDGEFHALADAIIYQQLAFAAARTIARRFREIYARDGAPRMPSPEALLATPARKLRAAGLSKQKISCLRDLAEKVARGSLRFDALRGASDERVLDAVTQVKGIGRWTGEMFLIFCLRRPDVLPVDDLGVQCGFRDAYGMKKLPAKSTMLRKGEAWRPYRTIATWYLWRLRRENTRSPRLRTKQGLQD
jgi:DNA-3-methyladenine glycosylase II